MTGAITIQADFTDATTSTVLLTEGGLVNVETIPGSDTDIDSLALLDVAGAIETKKIIFESTCTPEHPVYVRWINRFGGWDYHMFEGNKTRETTYDPDVIYSRADGTGIDSTRTRTVSEANREETLICGAEQLDENQFEFLAGIIHSPKIDTYNTTRKAWEGVTIEEKATARRNTATSLGSIEFEFRLIDQDAQF